MQIYILNNVKTPCIIIWLHVYRIHRACTSSNFFHTSRQGAASALVPRYFRMANTHFGFPYLDFTSRPPFPIFGVRPWRMRELRAALRAACALHCALCVPNPAPSSLQRVFNRQRTPVRPDLPGAAAVKVHVHCVTMRRARSKVLPSAPEPARCMGACIHEVESESCMSRCAHDMVGSGGDYTTLTAGV